MEQFPQSGATSEQITSPEAHQEALAAQHEVIQELHAELDRQFGAGSKNENGEQVNVTGALLEEADALALQLQKEVEKLNDMTAAYARERSAMPGTMPEGYGGVAHVVPEAERQFQAPALEDQTSVADVAHRRAA